LLLTRAFNEHDAYRAVEKKEKRRLRE